MTQFLQAQVEASPDPARAAAALDALGEAWSAAGRPADDLARLLQTFRLGPDALVHLLAISPISVEKIRREPEILEWLARPEISVADRGPRRMRAELAAMLGGDHSFDARFVALRRLHRRELLRAEKVVGGFVEHDVHRDDVRLGQHPFQRGEVGAERGRGCRIGERIGGED